jgi:hypothetical protein
LGIHGRFTADSTGVERRRWSHRLGQHDCGGCVVVEEDGMAVRQDHSAPDGCVLRMGGINGVGIDSVDPDRFRISTSRRLAHALHAEQPITHRVCPRVGDRLSLRHRRRPRVATVAARATMLSEVL